MEGNITEKKNHSNDPNSKQPIDEEGKYLPKTSMGETFKEQADIDDLDSEDFEGLEELNVSETFSDDDLEDLEQFGEDESTEKYAFNYVQNSVEKLSQEEAVEKSKKAILDMMLDTNCPYWFGNSFEAKKFKDQRIRLACLQALKKVQEDFPSLKKYYDGNRVSLRTYSAKSYWGQNKSMCQYFSTTLGSVYLYKFKPHDITISSSAGAPAGATVEEFAKNYSHTVEKKFHDELSSVDEMLHNVMFHELGHYVENAIINKMIQDGEIQGVEYGLFASNTDKKLESKIKGRIIEKAKEMFKDEKGYDPYYDASGYGKTKAAEWFAENFASMYSSKPRKAALALKEVLKEIFK